MKGICQSCSLVSPAKRHAPIETHQVDVGDLEALRRLAHRDCCYGMSVEVVEVLKVVVLACSVKVWLWNEEEKLLRKNRKPSRSASIIIPLRPPHFHPLEKLPGAPATTRRRARSLHPSFADDCSISPQPRAGDHSIYSEYAFGQSLSRDSQLGHVHFNSHVSSPPLLTCAVSVPVPMAECYTLT